LIQIKGVLCLRIWRHAYVYAPKRNAIPSGVQSPRFPISCRSQRAAFFVVRILKGKKPEDRLPIERSTTFAFTDVSVVQMLLFARRVGDAHVRTVLQKISAPDNRRQWHHAGEEDRVRSAADRLEPRVAFILVIAHRVVDDLQRQIGERLVDDTPPLDPP
jgi:hypothetical protein